MFIRICVCMLKTRVYVMHARTHARARTREPPTDRLSERVHCLQAAALEHSDPHCTQLPPLTICTCTTVRALSLSHCVVAQSVSICRVASVVKESLVRPVLTLPRSEATPTASCLQTVVLAGAGSCSSCPAA